MYSSKGFMKIIKLIFLLCSIQFLNAQNEVSFELENICDSLVRYVERIEGNTKKITIGNFNNSFGFEKITNFFEYEVKSRLVSRSKKIIVAEPINESSTNSFFSNYLNNSSYDVLENDYPKILLIGNILFEEQNIRLDLILVERSNSHLVRKFSGLFKIDSFLETY